MTTITVRDVPAEVRDELAARAARAGRSLQEHLRIELIELAARPSASDWVRDVQRRKSSSSGGLSREQILSYRDADRR
jgi:antitoxin FitA